MALVDYNLRYELPFKDIDGNQWRVRIYDRDEAGSVERLYGTGNPVSIYYEGDENLTKSIIGSSCTIRLLGVPNIESGKSDLTQFFVSDEERFYVLVQWSANGTDYNPYWSGFLHQDEYLERITSDPYEVELVALDRLGTLKTRLDSLGYNTNSEPTLKSIVEDLIDETKLELTLNEDTKLSTEDGDVNTFLEDQKVSAQTFFENDDEFVRMKNITDVVDNMGKATFCRIFQSSGNLEFQSFIPSLADFVDVTFGDEGMLSNKIVQKYDSLTGRYLPARRVTNISISTGARNLISNGSFEIDNDGDTTPTGWLKPTANVNASIEVSDEAYDKGSLKSIKTTNNRISDSTFNSASLSFKTGRYTLLETSTQDIELTYPLSPDTLLGKLKFRVFINNVDNSEPYEIRFSMSRSDGTSDLFYDAENDRWVNSFVHSFIALESTGEWQDVELDFSLSAFYFMSSGDPEQTAPIVLRIHTMNYKDNGSLTDVEVFYDNFTLKVYNGNGSSITAFLPETRYYNLSTDDDTSTKTDFIDLETDQGITTAEFRADTIVTGKFYLMDKKVLGQYWNANTDEPEDVSHGSYLLANYQPLPVTVMELRRAIDESARKVFSGVASTPRSAGEDWVPIKFSDRVAINYSGFNSSGSCIFTRFSFDLKANEYNVDFMTVG